ncbi:MAG TPA: dTDP-glucose 4,6-dehydratase [Polyangiaceae bacterium]|nr:dTDP-glucose 4,6-dehydratase [Polyangiaceae bacterium]
MSDPVFFVTGGAGFIGANLVHHLLAVRPNARVVVYDKLTYAGNLDSLEPATKNPRYELVQGDIADRELVRATFERVRPTHVMNLAAESHVDRSIDGPGVFMQTNVMGTFELLQATLGYVRAHETETRGFRFLHVSTDEVFGSLGPTGLFTEESQYQPNSPYSASKAGADHIVRAYHHTYGLPVVTTNCSNNYGPYQFPEKLIPLVTLNALEGKPLPVYGDGANVRDWLWVLDHCAALLVAVERGKPGETYNVGGRSERRNIDVVKTICAVLDELRPKATKYAEQITFVKDRPGHDRRYAIDASKIERELGFRPTMTFEAGIRKTVEWYLENRTWADRVTAGTYRRERLGHGT